MVYRFKMAFRAVWRRFGAGVVLKMSGVGVLGKRTLKWPEKAK